MINEAFQGSNVQVSVMCYARTEERNYTRTANGKKEMSGKDKRKIKTSIIGDSQSRGTGTLLETSSSLSNAEFHSWTQSGATTAQIANNINKVAAHLEPKDNLIIMSGTNDIQFKSNSANINFFRQARKNILSQAKKTKVLILSVPHRYDKEEANQMIDIYNDQLINLYKEEAEIMNTINNVRYLDINQFLNEGHYAKDGVHLNNKGKEILAGEIDSALWDFNQESETDF